MVAMPWANEAAPLKGSADRFAPTTKFNDGFFLLLMLANLIGVAVIAATDLPGLKAGIQKRDDDVVPASSIAVGVVIVLVPSLITGAACISLFFYLVQRNAELMLKVTLGLSLGMLVVLIGLLFGTGSLSGIACGPLSPHPCGPCPAPAPDHCRAPTARPAASRLSRLPPSAPPQASC